MVKLFSKKVIELDFYSFEHLTISSMHRDIRKAPVAGSFKVNWCGV